MANIIGTNGDDILVGTAAADVIRALNGTNNVHGGAGDDRLVGGNGYDTMDGGLGNDKLFGGDGNDLLIDQDSGNDQLYGQDGDDYLRISHNLVSRAENWVLDGGNGNDTISAGGNPLARISLGGGAGDDQISLGISNRANVDAGSGNDTVTIALGGRNQSITLGSGSDTLKLDDLSDGAILETIQITDFDATQDRVDLIEILRALIDWDETTNPFATGHLRLVQVDNSAVLEVRRHVWRDWQSIVTFQNSDVANFNSQNLGYHPDGSALIGETIFGTNGNDTLVGTNGADVIRALGGTNNVRGGAGDDRLVGGSGYDDMDGELGNDKLFGGDGNDYLRDSFSGNDQLYGQGGDDYLTISHGAGLNESWVLDGGDGNDILYVNSNPVGRVTMVGGAGDDQISVGVFNRVTVDAGSGNDIVTVTLTGRNQTITLGTGNDILMPIAPLYPAVQQIIQVTDFDVARDRLDINSILVALGNWDGTTNPFATGHLRLLQVGTSAILEFSRYGSGDWQGLVEFQNSNAADFDSQSLGYHPDGSALIGKTIIGTNGNDTLVGTHGADVIRALDGINTVNGGAGDDRLVGGNGYDTMDGGLGNDKLFGGNG
ncbi:MAG: calcium-binding protein, partial [Sphingobium yanoikuyae]|nr:calcium-binding protein [Sphingobium yanoikuyae]